MQRLESEKGEPMLGYEGYIYTKERKTEEKIIFRCQNRLCKGRCHTDPSMTIFIKKPSAHCHGPSIDQIPVIELKNKIKARAVISEGPTNAAAPLPKMATLQRTIRRQREAPTTMDNRISDELKKTHRGDNFILHEDDKLIIYTTSSNLSVLKICKHWFADGTFKVCPDDFYQLFTLHGLLKSQVVPLVYGLLIGKSASDYSQFFKRIMEEEDFNPDSILTDFESATINSIKSLFPNVSHKGKSNMKNEQ
ncbi:unnamed protein product [Adineta ricciae]|uniref:FLYWCH-type domain-containing protein n=1 Tax=Adineta ricciae TaxID=249248 RepID=A0A815TDL1_ADIRI|nr:unnamed protein product [Adineta ricciae]